MVDLYLTTPDKASFIADLKHLADEIRDDLPDFEGFVTQDEEGNDIIRAFTQRWSIVYYGKRAEQRGEYDEDGNEITPPVFFSGDRVNIRFHDDEIEGLVMTGAWNRVWRNLPNGTDILQPSRAGVDFAGGRAANQILPTGN